MTIHTNRNLIHGTLVLLLGCLYSVRSDAQIGVSHYSLESACASSDIVVLATIEGMKIQQNDRNGFQRATISIAVKEKFKGDQAKALTFDMNFARQKESVCRKILLELKRIEKSKEPRIWMLDEKPTRGKKQADTTDSPHLRLAYFYRMQDTWNPLAGHHLMSMQNYLKPINDQKKLFAAIRVACREVRNDDYLWRRDEIGHLPYVMIPTGFPVGDVNGLELVDGQLLEKLSRQLVAEPDKFVNRKIDPKNLKHSHSVIRLEGIKLLARFRSDKNIALVKKYLQDNSWTRRVEQIDPQANQPPKSISVKFYDIRDVAYRTLVNWGVDVQQPKIIER